MITHKQIKFVRSLKQKKNRTIFFVVEGEKLVDELLMSSFEVEHIYHSAQFEVKHPKAEQVSEKDLGRMTHLKTHAQVLSVVKKANNTLNFKPDKRYVALDGIKDPGNLGTIIRLADWFNIDAIICSETCVDVYNSKTIQSAMGSAFRVPVIYEGLSRFLANKDVPVIGAVLNGENIHKRSLPSNGVLVIGNESSGISENIMPLLTNKISIPKFGEAESLNAAMACGIICNEWLKF